jgi:hypothetical protein
VHLVVQRIELALGFEHRELIRGVRGIGSGYLSSRRVGYYRETKPAATDLIVVTTLWPAALEPAKVAEALRGVAAHAVARAANLIRAAQVAARPTISRIPAQICAFAIAIIRFGKTDRNALPGNAFTNARIAWSRHTAAEIATQPAVAGIALQVDTTLAARRPSRACNLRHCFLVDLPGHRAEDRGQAASHHRTAAPLARHLADDSIEALAIHFSSPPDKFDDMTYQRRCEIAADSPLAHASLSGSIVFVNAA